MDESDVKTKKRIRKINEKNQKTNGESGKRSEGKLEGFQNPYAPGVNFKWRLLFPSSCNDLTESFLLLSDENLEIIQYISQKFSLDKIIVQIQRRILDLRQSFVPTRPHNAIFFVSRNVSAIFPEALTSFTAIVKS